MNDPVLCVVLGDSDQWWVEAEWPDGTIEQINNFKRYSDAAHWLKLHCEVWVQQRTAVLTAENSQKLIPKGKMDHAVSINTPPHKQG